MSDRARIALEPGEDEIRRQRLSTNAAMAAELLGGIGATGGAVLDVGCGDGKFTRGLTGLFAAVTGVDPKEKAIARARAAAAAEGKDVEFLVGDGQALPFEDGRFDAVVISNSLHHIPDPRRGLAEAARVLRPGGALYVMEPVASGHYFEATRLVNDETLVRREAYAALLEIAGAGFSEVAETMYRIRRAFDSFEEWKADQIDRDDRRRARFDAQPDVVRDHFVSHADKEDGKLAFDQVFRVNLLRKDG